MRTPSSNTLRLVSKTSAALAYVSGQKYFSCWWWSVVGLITELARKQDWHDWHDWFHHPFFFPSGAMIDRKSKAVSQNTPHR